MCVSLSDKPFDAEACNIGGQASATNGLSDMKTPSKTHRVIDPLGAIYTCDLTYKSAYDSVYDFLLKVVSDLIFDRFTLKCVDKRL
jgi:hypothetical protein